MRQSIKYTVNRGTWRSGRQSTYQTGTGTTYLLNEEGYMCCLGHCLLSEGFKKEDLYLRAVPTTIVDTRPQGYKQEVQLPHGLIEKAISINDNETTTREEKEKELINVFRIYGCELEFTGEYPCSLE